MYIIAWLVKWCNECLMIYVGLQTSGSSMRVVWWSVVGGTVPCGEPTPDVIPAGSGLDPLLLCYTLVNTLQRPYQKQDNVTSCQRDTSFINSTRSYFVMIVMQLETKSTAVFFSQKPLYLPPFNIKFSSKYFWQF